MARAEDNDSVLFLRKQVQSDNNEAEWDDSKLVKAFDKAISRAKFKILKKIQQEEGLEEDDVSMKELKKEMGLTEEGTSLTPSESSSVKKKKRKNKKNTKKNKAHCWSVGDKCRAVYSEDGEEYEAEIIAMIYKNWCRVRYVGYNNEEEVMLKELLPSLGPNVIELQIERAKQDAMVLEDLVMESGVEDDDIIEESHHENPQEATCKPSASMSKQLPPFYRRFVPQRPAIFDPSAPLPPPPPMPPFAPTSMMEKPFGVSPFPQLPSGSDAQHSMLISWYMCGYYTGVYQRDLMNHQHSSRQYPQH